MVGNKTPRGIKTHIALIGRTNVGKSSLVNAITKQDVAIVSQSPGTTTDPISKPFELIPVGPVTFFDTAGFNDVSEIGEKRIKATNRIILRCDIAILITDEAGITEFEKDQIKKLKDLDIPFLLVFNKTDLTPSIKEDIDYCNKNNIKYIRVSAKEETQIEELKKDIASIVPEDIKKDPLLAGDLIEKDANVMLVVPIDLSAPKGRLILPQVMTIREMLDENATVNVVKETHITKMLDNLKNLPDLAVTDSQAILKVAKDVPKEVKLTTFSILFARYKGDLKLLIEGAKALDNLKDGDKILIAEACSHHTEEDDIGRYKIPKWIKEYSSKDVSFDFCTGHDFPQDLEKYKLVINCGACMLNRVEMMRRIKECERRNVPISNYGVIISKTNGVLERVIEPFGYE